MQYVEDKHGNEGTKLFFFALQIASRTKLRAFVFVPGSAGSNGNEYRSPIVAKFVECTDIVHNHAIDRSPLIYVAAMTVDRDHHDYCQVKKYKVQTRRNLILQLRRLCNK